MPSEGMQCLKHDGIENVWLENNGYVAIISKRYNVNCSSVYSAMRKHCEQGGKIYRSFLRQPHKPHKQHVIVRRGVTKTTELSFTECISHISYLIKSEKDEDLLEAIDLLIQQVEKEF